MSYCALRLHCLVMEIPIPVTTQGLPVQIVASWPRRKEQKVTKFSSSKTLQGQAVIYAGPAFFSCHSSFSVRSRLQIRWLIITINHFLANLCTYCAGKRKVLPKNKRENLAAVRGFPGAGSSQQDGQKWPYLLLANLLYLHTKWSIKRVFRIYLKFRGFVTKLLLQHRLTIWHNSAGFGITTAINKIIISLSQLGQSSQP